MKIKLKTNLGTYVAKVTPGTDFEFPLKDGATAMIRTYIRPSLGYSTARTDDGMLQIDANIRYDDENYSTTKQVEVDLCTKSVTLKDKNKVLT